MSPAAPVPASGESATCAVRGRHSRALLTFEAVADTPDGHDIAWVGGIVLDLLTESPDVDGQRMAIAVGAPEAFEELLAGEDLTGRLRQQLQQFELAGGELDWLAVD